jgi:AAA domain
MDSKELLTQATDPMPQCVDTHLRGLSRDKVLELDSATRLRWFFLLQTAHPELERVTSALEELLMPDNETKIVSIIGMTGIGKTTLAHSLQRVLNARFSAHAHASEMPVVYVPSPANGEKSLSWTGLYTRILEAGRETLIDKKRAQTVSGGVLQVIRGGRATLTELRNFIEHMLKIRNVQVLIIDEVLHLLRFESYSAVMDTLKSLADAHSTKLVLIGSYDIAERMIEYGQVARRGEIIHYRRYLPGVINAAKLTDDQEAFRQQVAKFQAEWPCAWVPNLQNIWGDLMKHSLGSIGMLKTHLLRLSSLQMTSRGEQLTLRHIHHFLKPPKAAAKILQETLDGEALLRGACYGDSPLSDEECVKMLDLLQAA